MASTTKTENQQEDNNASREQPQADQKQTNQLATQNRRSGNVFGPFSLIRNLFRDFERMTGLDVYGGERERDDAGELLYMPRIDVVRRDDKLVVRADLPGMAPDDVSVTIDDGSLIIEGERQSERDYEEGGNVWRAERSYGRFERVIPLPEGADPESCEARFDNGVLEIELRAPEPKSKGRKVDIATGPRTDKQRQTISH